MIKLNLKQILRNRITQRTNKRFVKWRVSFKKGDLHHWLGSYQGAKKWNDYFLVDIDKKLHNELERGKNKMELESEYEIKFLIETLENIFNYIEKLEKEIYDLHNA